MWSQTYFDRNYCFSENESSFYTSKDISLCLLTQNKAVNIFMKICNCI